MRLAPLVLFPLLAACESTAPAPRTYLSTSIFQDIPAPRDTVYLDRKHESFSYQSQSFRSGKFVYTWQGPQSDAIRFYKETMTAPPYSWTLTKEEAPVDGSTRLEFLKGEDRCTVDIDHVPRPQQQQNISIVVRVNYLR